MFRCADYQQRTDGLSSMQHAANRHMIITVILSQIDYPCFLTKRFSDDFLQITVSKSRIFGDQSTEPCSLGGSRRGNGSGWLRCICR